MKLFWALCAFAAPSILFLAALAGFGTLFGPLLIGQRQNFHPLDFVEFFIGPLGLFALAQLLRVVAAVSHGGVKRIHERRRVVWLGAAAGLIPTAFHLPVAATLFWEMKRELSLFAFIGTGIPLLPLLAFIYWGSLHPREFTED